MTVLVGVLCEDGVAIGADSVETFGLEPGLRTIEQLGIKIDVVAGRAILAGTGYVGHMQRFRRRMEKLVKGSEGKSLAWNDAVESGALIAETMINEWKRTPSHLQHQPQFGYQFGALVAFASAAGPELFSFDPIQFQPERKGDADAERGDRTGRIVSLGSGQSLADPFLSWPSSGKRCGKTRCLHCRRAS